MALSEDQEGLLDLDQACQDLPGPGQQGQLAVGLDEQHRDPDPRAPRVAVVVGGPQELRGGRGLTVVESVEASMVLGRCHRLGVGAGAIDLDPLRVEEALHEGLSHGVDVRVVVGHAVDGGALEPRVHGLAQVGPIGLGLLHARQGRRGAAVGVVQRGDVAARSAEGDPLVVLEPEQDLDLPELGALEPARGHQLVAERQVLPRPEGLDHLEVLGARAEDGGDAAQACGRSRELLLGDPVTDEQVAGRQQLVADELEPQLEDLMDRDEQELLVLEGRLVPLEPALQGQQLLHLDVVPVGRPARRAHGGRIGARSPAARP